MCIDLLVTGADVLFVGSGLVRRMMDVSVAAGRIVAVGSSSGSREQAHRIIDGRGSTVVPLVVHTLTQQPEIEVGNEASFAVVSRRVSAGEANGAFVVNPADLVAVVLAGELVVAPSLTSGTLWAGSRVTLSPLPPDSPRLGTWIDRTGYLHQELDSTGRYDETRAGRRHAWTGQYWVRGDRIVYLDDTGFWAFGEFSAELSAEPDSVTGDELHHAGYVMRLG